MAKKRFTEDLFGLFEPEQPTTTPATDAAAGAEEERVEVEVPVTRKSRRKLSGKNFTQDLDAYLSDSFAAESKATEPNPRTRPLQRRRRRSGLDLLIQSTVTDDPDRQPRGGNTAETKRVTLIFNKEHLVTLKEIAKQRKVYLKDLVGEMVEDYLKE
ncbi:MAG: hypothetical protein AAF433_10475 [Bacteroidota bacterium]